MFDIGGGELLLIGIVALIAIGPKELPTVLRTLGQTAAQALVAEIARRGPVPQTKSDSAQLLH